MADRTEVDFTKARLGSKPYGVKIARCPKCGRKGEFVVYSKSSDKTSWRCFHKARRGFIGLVITDGCYGKET